MCARSITGKGWIGWWERLRIGTVVCCNATALVQEGEPFQRAKTFSFWVALAHYLASVCESCYHKPVVYMRS